MEFYLRYVRPIVLWIESVHNNPKKFGFWAYSIPSWAFLIYLFLKFTILKAILIYLCISLVIVSIGVFIGIMETRYKHTTKRHIKTLLQ